MLDATTDVSKEVYELEAIQEQLNIARSNIFTFIQESCSLKISKFGYVVYSYLTNTLFTTQSLLFYENN